MMAALLRRLGHNLAVNMPGIIAGLGTNKPFDPEPPFATDLRLVLHRVNYHALLHGHTK